MNQSSTELQDAVSR